MSAVEDDVVLVDERDQPTGVAPKMRAHREGLLHRAISAIVVDHAGRMLLQRRAVAKYHSGGLWTNACCSHPRPDEAADAAARRRLREEMGVSTPLEPMFSMIYRAPVGDLVEHEFVHVFGGVWDGPVTPDPDEVEATAWETPDAIIADMNARPERYTAWFRLYMTRRRESVDALVARARKSGT